MSGCSVGVFSLASSGANHFARFSPLSVHGVTTRLLPMSMHEQVSFGAIRLLPKSRLFALLNDDGAVSVCHSSIVVIAEAKWYLDDYSSRDASSSHSSLGRRSAKTHAHRVSLNKASSASQHASKSIRKSQRVRALATFHWDRVRAPDTQSGKTRRRIPSRRRNTRTLTGICTCPSATVRRTVRLEASDAAFNRGFPWNQSRANTL